MVKHDRPNRTEGRLVLDLLRTGRTDPAGWLPVDRAAVEVLHLWAYGGPGRYDPRPLAQASLPSELLRGLSFILSAEVLDNLPLLNRDPAGRLDPAPLAGGQHPGEPIRVPPGFSPSDGDPPDGYEANLDALRAEVARLTGLLDEAEAQTVRLREAHDEQVATVRTYREERDEARAEVVRLGQQFYRAPEDREETSPHPIEEDPRRPHLDSWPDDAVLLRYRELRRLVSLHLDRYGADAEAVRAMLEGDVPLRVSEVLA